MSAYRDHKILDAIADCDRYIEREEPRDPEWRPPEIAKLLEWTIVHRQKLILMLAEGE